MFGVAVPDPRRADSTDDDGERSVGNDSGTPRDLDHLDHPDLRNGDAPRPFADRAVNERGSILPLVAGLFALAGVFAVGVIDSTDLALSRTELQTVADGAALAAAGVLPPISATVDGGALRPTLTTAVVRRETRAFIRDSAVKGIAIRVAAAPDSRTAVVTLSRTWRAPLDSEFLPIRIRITATARARTVFG